MPAFVTVLVWLAIAFLAGVMAAQSAVGGVLSTENITVTYSHSGTTFTVVSASALSSGASTDDVLGQAYLNRISALGGSIVGGDLWVLTATAASPNPDTVSDLPVSITSGYFYRLTVRTLTRTTPGVNEWHPTAINTYEFTGGANEKRVTIKLPINRTDFPIEYRLMQDGAQVGTVTLQPGQGLIQTFTVPGTSQVTVLARVEGLYFDGDAWEVLDEAVTEQQVGGGITPTDTGTPPETELPSPTLPESSNPSSNPINSPATNNTVNKNAYRPIWSPFSGQTAGEQTDLLTIPAYREGIEKLLQTKQVEAEDEEMEFPEAEEFPEVDTSELIPEEAPNFFTGSIGTSTTINFSSPSFTVGGRTFPAMSKTIDLSDYDTAVSYFRALCSVVLWVIYFALCVRTGRSAAADQ